MVSVTFNLWVENSSDVLVTFTGFFLQRTYVVHA